MKVSYKVLKKYIPDIPSPEKVAQMLIMHTAEVEEIYTIGKHLEKVYIWKIQSVTKHPDADKLNICQVLVLWESRQIICGAPNVKKDLIVAVALPGAELKPSFVIQKSKIRGETSNGMLCSEDELGLVDQRQDGIMELPEDAPLDTCAREYFGFDDVILEIDNKAINHRPDLFSHIGIAREIEAIRWKKLGYMMSWRDFRDLPKLGIQNHIPLDVKRYMWLKVSWVKNITSPSYIKDVLISHSIEAKGLLIDITNYSLYLYGQPTHCFDADKLVWDIHIRYAKNEEVFHALNGKTYTLKQTDIVIADDSGVIALWGIIWWTHSAVSDTTTNIIIESAWFNHASVRKTGKRLWIRTDALNVFEKDLVSSIRETGPSLIIKELEIHNPHMKLEAFCDVYPEPEYAQEILFEKDRITSLIWKEYSHEEIMDILDRIFIQELNGKLQIPLWRKDLTTIADIAEEVARLDGYDTVKSTIPRINIWAISQSSLYRAKRWSRNHLVSRGFTELYTYSFVDEKKMQKTLSSLKDCIAMKNPLSEELTHLRPSLIPNLLEALEENTREYKDMKIFECEKVFKRNGKDTIEYYELSCLIEKNANILYYDILSELRDLLSFLWVSNYSFDTAKNPPDFAHRTRSADILVQGQVIGQVGEIHPKVAKNFSLSGRVGFFCIELEKIENALYSKIQTKEVSQYQENNFDLSFVVHKETSGKDIVTAIKKSDTLIKKVELFDIYESEDKIPWKRSLSFKVYIQSLFETLDDVVKNRLIDMIVANVEKKGWKLR